MEIRNNTVLPKSNVAFGANVDIALASELRRDAARVSKSMLGKFDEQLAQVSKWGDKASEITSSFSLNGGARELSLYNEQLSSSYGASLPQKENLLSSFLGLRKKDIIKAEKQIEDTVTNNKLDLIVKATQDDALAEKITGKVLPSDEEFAAAIDRLSEEEITNLRFGLDENQEETGNLLDFVF